MERTGWFLHRRSRRKKVGRFLWLANRMGEAGKVNGVDAVREGDAVTVRLLGDWRLDAALPEPRLALPRGEPPATVRVDLSEVGEWDSALPLYLARLLERARKLTGREELELEGLPEDLKVVVRAAGQVVAPPTSDRSSLWLRLPEMTGRWSRRAGGEAVAMVDFFGQTLFALGGALRRPWAFRWRECLEEMYACGARGLPIIGLISFLVGLIMAFQAAVQLRQFGADIYVADLVGLAVVREMGPMMAAVTLAGRTGAAYAAHLGNMRVGEEIDALTILGFRPVDFLVLPRLAALVLMTPLLALYANVLGILGGLVVGSIVIDFPPYPYLLQTRSALGLMDVGTGLFKAVVFGYLIGYAGCLRGLHCEATSAGVGRAATSAVVTGILLIIIADAVFAVIFNALGW